MRVLLARFLLAAALALPLAARAATPPGQPASGPGGADNPTAEIVKSAVGTASAATYVFHAAGEPSEPRPVVVFLHAWGAVDPQVYGGWIDHLARRGALVLWPRYQVVNRTRPADAAGIAAGLVKSALADLAADPQARPDPDRVAFVGHLAGAPVAVNLAATAAAEGLPRPKLVMAVMPGGIAKDAKARGIPLADLSGIDPATLVIAMSGDRDYLASDRAGRRILKEASEVPATRKLFVRALSDDHGFPVLSATLASPGSSQEAYDGARIRIPPDPPGRPPNRTKWSADMALTGEQTVLVNQLASNVTDAMDYLAFWKTLDMAMTAAFSGKDGQDLRNDPAFPDMGRWSDGWPVKRLTVDMPRTDAPAETGSRSASGKR